MPTPLNQPQCSCHSSRSHSIKGSLRRHRYITLEFNWGEILEDVMQVFLSLSLSRARARARALSVYLSASLTVCKRGRSSATRSPGGRIIASSTRFFVCFYSSRFALPPPPPAPPRPCLSFSLSPFLSPSLACLSVRLPVCL